MAEPEWWEEDYGFFGDFYIEGDNSNEGHKEQKKKLSERTKEESEGVIKLLKLKGNEIILDIPCGYGRHSIYLAGRGFKVTASDINSKLIKTAKEMSKNLKIEWKKENMLEITYNERFDVLINMFYSFGFFKTDKQNMEALKRFYKSLKPKGKFLMHTDVNILRIKNGKYKFNETRTLKSGKILKIKETFDEKINRIIGSWSIVDKNAEIKKNYSVRVYTEEEFSSMCREVGFKEVKVYGDWKGNKYSNGSEEMIIVAEK